MKRLFVFTFGLLVIHDLPAMAGQEKNHGAGKGPRSFEAMDTNGDKALSKEEVINAPRLSAEFDKADTDKNGTVSKEELQAFRAAHRAERKK